MREREYQLLEAISEDENVTQAGLASRLGMAVGSVNWYIKRLIGRGYLKATRMDRTRLRYNLTTEGMAAFRHNAAEYVRDSLRVYFRLRNDAKETISRLQDLGVDQVFLEGEEAQLDIFRLTCIEAGIQITERPTKWTVKAVADGYKLKDGTVTKETS